MLLFVLVMVLSVAAPAAASGDGPIDPTTTDSGGMGGVVPPHGQQQATPSGFTLKIGPNLDYHGGPVMTTNKTYAIYWLPSGYRVAANYRPIINQFFTDVAADSGMSTNVYFAATQYFGPGAVNILYSSTFGGAYTDKNPFPANGCPLKAGFTQCLSDAQLRVEIARVIKLKHWVANPTTMFFIFTPNHVRSCFGSACSFTKFCAYHSYFGKVIYANQPYTYAKPGSCGIQYGTATPPNGAAVDSTISVISHEHNEAITDPRLTAWYASTGDENGDKCAWTFWGQDDSVLVPFPGYNQTINGHHYVVQEEWSNSGWTSSSAGCVLTGLTGF